MFTVVYERTEREADKVEMPTGYLDPKSHMLSQDFNECFSKSYCF